MEKCIWLKPRLVAAIDYAEWTPANHLRHSKFIALREDKDAIDAKIRRGIAQLDRGEGIPEERVDAHLKELKAQPE